MNLIGMLLALSIISAPDISWNSIRSVRPKKVTAVVDLQFEIESRSELTLNVTKQPDGTMIATYTLLIMFLN